MKSRPPYLPPIIKIYEALTALGDGRVHVQGNTGTVGSSNGDKTYQVVYDPEANTIVANDNETFWQKRMGYPALCYLLQTKVVQYNPKAAELMAGINWKKLNASLGRDYNEAIAKILAELKPADRKLLESEVEKIAKETKALKIALPSKLMRPVPEPKK